MLISKLEKTLFLEVTKTGKLEVKETRSERITIELKTLSNITSTRLMMYMEAAKKEIDTLEGNGVEKFMNLMSGLIVKIHNSEIKPDQLQFPTLIAIADKLLAESVISIEESAFLE